MFQINNQILAIICIAFVVSIVMGQSQRDILPVFCVGLIVIILLGNYDQLGGAELTDTCGYTYFKKAETPYCPNSIFFQNCNGLFLIVDKPNSMVQWTTQLNPKSCFIIKSPIFDVTTKIDNGNYKQIHVCSIESAYYHGSYLRVYQNKIVLDTPDNTESLDHKDFVFQIEKGLNDKMRTVSLRPVHRKYGYPCIFDNDEGLVYNEQECKADKNTASFYIGPSVTPFDWWWKDSVILADEGDYANPQY